MEKVNRPEFLSWGNSKLGVKHPFNKSMTRDTHTTKHHPDLTPDSSTQTAQRTKINTLQKSAPRGNTS